MSARLFPWHGALRHDGGQSELMNLDKGEIQVGADKSNLVSHLPTEKMHH